MAAVFVVIEFVRIGLNKVGDFWEWDTGKKIIFSRK